MRPSPPKSVRYSIATTLTKAYIIPNRMPLKIVGTAAGNMIFQNMSRVLTLKLRPTLTSVRETLRSPCRVWMMIGIDAGRNAIKTTVR